jgi:hypothetical protein
METNVLLQIGCEPGSEFCGECKQFEPPQWGPIMPHCRVFNATLGSYVGGQPRGKRCPACLAAEAAGKRAIGPETERALAGFEMESNLLGAAESRNRRFIAGAIRAALAADEADLSPGLGGE